MSRREVIASTVFHGGLVLLLILILSDSLASLLPPGLARRLANNSEGYAFAVVLAVWLQVRRGGPQRWITAAAALGMAAIGTALLVVSVPDRIRTLNESALALAVLIPYTAVRRPLPRWVAPGIAGGVVLVVVVGLLGTPTRWVVDLAEALGFLAITPLALDVVDRGILEPQVRTQRWRRWSWYGLLALLPVAVSLAGSDRRGPDGLGPQVLEYLGRVHESLVGVLLLVVFMAVCLGRSGRRDALGPSDAPAERVGDPLCLGD